MEPLPISVKNMETKKDLRKRAAVVRDNISALDRKQKSDLIMSQLLNSNLYRNADCVITYVSFRSEVDTISLIGDANKDGKTVFCPKVNGDSMSFFQVKDLSALRAGVFGILEPAGTEPVFSRKNFSDVIVLVPGLSFQPDGSRLGYGGGYYDRFLFENSSLIKVGLCYSEQLKENVIMDEHDMRMDYLVTENGIMDCNPTIGKK